MISMSACVMLLAAILKGSVGQTVEQTEGLVIIPQGSKLSLKCSFQSSFTTNYPFWYIQHPGQAPKLFMREFSKEFSDEGHLRGFSATHEKNNKTFNLEKAAIQLNDSAAYFCAVSDTVRLANREAEQKLAKKKDRTEHRTEYSGIQVAHLAWM
ncbi:T-cell receptor alpha chain V region CTL-F3 [Podarcis lilfordi]|nr:T-cell receptor alpha chain V region CTL-F3 [Podarcis lilfordi]